MPHRIVVTGASGFLGRYVVDLALNSGCEVITIGRVATDTDIAFNDPSLESKLTLFSPNVILHLAASYGDEAKSIGLEANLLLALRLLNWSISIGESKRVKFITMGSFWQFGDQQFPGAIDMYSATKESLIAFLDYYRRIEHIECYQLILSSTFGPSDGRGKLLDLLINAAKCKNVVNVGDETKQFYLTDVRDVAAAVLQLATQPQVLPELRYKVRDNKLHSFKTLSDIFSLYGYDISFNFSKKLETANDILTPNDEHIPTLPEWSPTYSVEDYIFSELSRENLIEPKGKG